MEQRRLGTNGPTVSAIGLGCMGMSQSYGTRDDEKSIRAIHRAVDEGITFFDTAAIYGEGHNETLVGRALAPRRKDIVLATKCGIILDSAFGIEADGSPAAITSSCDDSLRRLGTDVIDVFYLHRVDPKVPIEESVGAMAALVRAGKVRHLGLSEAAPPTIRRAHKVHPIAALQSEYSLWYREVERDVLPVCRELGIAFVPFSPLGRGFLSGAVKSTATLAENDVRRRLPRFEGSNLDHNLRLVSSLEQMAARKRCAPAQLALAWLLAKGKDIEELESTFTRDAAAGDRYTEAMGRLVDRSG